MKALMLRLLGLAIIGLFSALNASAAVTIDLATALHNVWMDSGTTVSAGQTWTFTANGSWRVGDPPTWPATDANGISGDFGDTYVNNATHSSLVAFVGTQPADPGTFAGVPSGTGGYYAVGASATIPFSAGGKLWFGINDDASSGATTDNSGRMVVDMSVVPEPTTLLAGALLLLPFGASTIRFIRKNKST